MHSAKTLSAAVICLLTAVSAGAQIVPIGNEFQVNTYTTGFQSGGVATRRSSSDDFVIVWNSQQDGNWGIFAQLFDSGGSAVGTEFQVNAATSGAQTSPAVTRPLIVGAPLIVTWNAFDGHLIGVFGRRFESTGNPLGTEFQVNVVTYGLQQNPQVGPDFVGGFLVVWEDNQGSDWNVLGRRYDSSGSPVGMPFQVNTYSTGTQSSPRVTPSGLVVWESIDQDGDSSGIFGQRLGVGSEFQVNMLTVGMQTQPSVTEGPSGTNFVVWAHNDGVDDEIGGRMIPSSGPIVGGAFQINSYVTGIQSAPVVGANPVDGEFVVAWSDISGRDGDLLGVFAQHFDSSGIALGEEFQVNAYTTDSQGVTAVVGLGTGRFLVTLTSPHDESYAGVFGRVLQRHTATPTPTFPTWTPTPMGGGLSCSSAPMSGCETPAKSSLKLRADTQDPSRQSFSWKWLNGTVSLQDLGDPLGATNYLVCLYNGGSLLQSILMGSGEGWSSTSSGYKYLDKAGIADGVTKAVLKAGTGKAKILIKGRGANLNVDLPAPMSDVTVQFSTSDGAVCYEDTYLAPAVKEDSTYYKDKNPQ